MGYRNLRECLADLERTGQLVRIEDEIDPHLEAAEIHRRVYAAGGPAVLYARVKGCRFPMVSNLFGTKERMRFLFRDALDAVRHLVELKVDPSAFWRNPWRYRDVPRTLWTMRPKRVRRPPVAARQTTVEMLPQLVCWPRDGGAFITLPEVYTEHPDRPGWRHSNLGMYRIQLSGGRYEPNREAGMHYQIHRSIGVHHAAAIRRGERLRVNVFVGGPPALALAAVMPLPEGIPELAFAGALGRRRVGLASLQPSTLPLIAEADFCIVGSVDPQRTKPEGPFGDHLGYYSLAHDFPVLDVEAVYHREGAIWPFTVVGRPPQEDTSFGEIIHEITGPVIPSVVAGVHAVHAVDAAGVHPLLLAIGSERYVPYAGRRRPQELLTSANAILGQGQLSLAKYLLIVAREDDPRLDIHDVAAFFAHVLRRVDWETDLHFQTRTTIDTLDYSGTGLNEGSKLVIAAAGPPRRDLPTELPADLALPDGFGRPHVCLPGVLCIEAPRFRPDHHSLLRVCERKGTGTLADPVFAGMERTRREPVPFLSQTLTPHHSSPEPAVARFCEALDAIHPVNGFPLVVLADDSEFTARSLANFAWVTFTRSNPAADVHGLGSFIHQKHWGCRGSLVIDARIKPHHAPPLVEDPEVTRRVDRLAAPGGPLHGIL
ncbi:MAG TPA: UbiD family decarboxylase [Planctomycetaceae bacterium]|nr:UbiD family decarboxylase [Planctomycetaceae bacterium]